MVTSFPLLSPTVARTYFELLLLMEVVLQLQRTVNVVSYFPTWLRSALKKGAFKVDNNMVGYSAMICTYRFIIILLIFEISMEIVTAWYLYSHTRVLFIFQSAWQEQVPVQLQQKRMKVRSNNIRSVCMSLTTMMWLLINHTHHTHAHTHTRAHTHTHTHTHTPVPV